MSLINDALKKAQEAQKTSAPAPVAPGPDLRPAEPAQATLRGAGLVMPGVFAVLALLALFMAWQAVQRRNQAVADPDSASFQVRAKSTGSSFPPATTLIGDDVEVVPTGGNGEPLPNRVAVMQGSTTTARPRPAPPALQTVVDTEPLRDPAIATSLNGPGPAASAPAGETPGTNAPLAGLREPPRPAPLRLQGVVLRPNRPSAMINGRTVFPGDRIGEFRVLKITSETVTLTAPNEQKVLVLGD